MQNSIEKFDNAFDWSGLDELANYVIEEAIRIQQIPSPTFDEKQRAEYVETQFDTHGLHDVRIDERFNVYGTLPGEDTHSHGLMLSAHTDTVFPKETDLAIKREDGLIYGPGLGDNSMAVAGMMAALKYLQEHHITLPCDLHLVATSREEGLGDLGGMRLAYKTLKDKIKAIVNIEGLSFGYIYNAGIAVLRHHIIAHADGGHSWLHFGRESALHGMTQLGAKISQLDVPESPRTTFNIGMMNGGHSINSIATEAHLWLDLRSEERTEVDKLDQLVREFMDEIANDDLTFESEIVSDRPSGSIPDDHPLVQMAQAALEKVGVKGSLEIGSTDGNIPLSDGFPCVTIGITRGGNAHRLDEYVETPPIPDGLRQLIMLVAAACAWKP